MIAYRPVAIDEEEDIGRVLEIPLPKCDQLAKMVPDDPKILLEKALKLEPRHQEARELLLAPPVWRRRQPGRYRHGC